MFDAAFAFHLRAESRRVQDQLLDLYSRRRARDGEQAAMSLAPLPRDAPPAVPVVARPPRVIAPPTAADREFDRVRTAALDRQAAERAEAAEVNAAVAMILDSTRI